MNLAICFLFFLLISIGCVLDIQSQNGEINYYHFDFSAGATNADDNYNDIGFAVDPNDSSMIFTSLVDTEKNNIKDLGDIAFNSIDRINAYIEWDSISYIYLGHIYLIECVDGFAKFKVLSYSGNNLFNTKIYILYEFSNDSLF